MVRSKMCKACFIVKNVNQFYEGRAICKDCKSSDNANYEINKNAEKNPKNYMVCNGCDRTFRKYKDNRKECKFCGSNDVESY